MFTMCVNDCVIMDFVTGQFVATIPHSIANMDAVCLKKIQISHVYKQHFDETLLHSQDKSVDPEVMSRMLKMWFTLNQII